MREQVQPEEHPDEVTGRPEIARRRPKLVSAPFIKASNEIHRSWLWLRRSIVRDLVENAIRMVREGRSARAVIAEDRLVTLLVESAEEALDNLLGIIRWVSRETPAKEERQHEDGSSAADEGRNRRRAGDCRRSCAVAGKRGSVISLGDMMEHDAQKHEAAPREG